MGWRTDFKKALIAEFKKIEGIGTVQSKYTQKTVDTPSLVISLVMEEYERFFGGKGIISVRFEIKARVKDLDDPDEAKEDLLDEVIKGIEGIEGYDIILEDTDFHDKTEGGGPMFTLTGRMEELKDYSDM
jgi:hypothetical protein